MPAIKKSADGTTFPVIDIETFTTANQYSLTAMAHIGTDTLRHVIDTNRQFLDFVRGRLDEDAKVAETLATCKDPNDALEAVNEFYKMAFDQWADEMRELGDRTAKTVTDTMQTVEKEMKRSAEVAKPAA